MLIKIILIGSSARVFDAAHNLFLAAGLLN